MRTVAGRHLCVPRTPATVPGRTHLMAYNGCTGSFNYGVGLAISWDQGQTWEKWQANPVLATVAATWESTQAKDPWLVKCGARDYRIWYSGSNNGPTNPTYQIGYATSPDGLAWTKYGSNPVLTPGSAGAWDVNTVRFPTVLYEPSDVTRPFKMWYGGSNTSSPGTGIGYAYSTDGIAWTKSSANPVLTLGTTYDKYVMLPAGIIKIGGTYYLFYGSSSQSSFLGDGVAVASFTDPEGTYTKSASNPLLAPSTAWQALTADLSAGSAVVTVSSTTGFHVNEPVLLDDSTLAIADAYVLSVDSSTQLTLKASPSGSHSWTVANSASIRSYYYLGLAGRSVLPNSGGGYISYVTPYDQYSTSPYTERSGAATSVSLTSGWAFDYTRGIVLPLGNLWDTISAENPSVIAE